MKLQRRDWAGLVFALVVAAVCVRLGVWQLDRLRQRRAGNAVALAARERPPLGVRGGAGGALTADAVRDRRLRARGVYDYADERPWPGRSHGGIPGVDLLTPPR